MNAFTDFWLQKNPIDGIARIAFGLPQSLKEFLATHFNPRPAGIMLRAVVTPLKPWPWTELSDGEFSDEMRHNSGAYLSVLLRAPNVTNRADFVHLFDAVEAEYRASLRRLLWPGAGGWMTEHRADLALKRMGPALKRLEEPFVRWAVMQRPVVEATIGEMMEKEQWLSGNARNDLARANPSWLAARK